MKRYSLIVVAILSLSFCATKPNAANTSSIQSSDVNAPYHEQQDAHVWATSFEREGREVYDKQAAIVSALELKPGMTVADIGAGTGLFTIPMAHAVGSQGKVYAVDIMPYFLAYIQVQAQKNNILHIETVQATSTSVNLPKASLDLAFMCDSYHHIAEPKMYMQSVFDALKPGGSLVVIDYHRREGISKPWVWDHVRASREEVLRELEAVGFKLVKEPSLLQENYLLYLRK